jgi:F0F1-type ATP synthase assembly protein I
MNERMNERKKERKRELKKEETKQSKERKKAAASNKQGTVNMDSISDNFLSNA